MLKWSSFWGPQLTVGKIDPRSATWRLLTCKKLPSPPGPGMARHGLAGNNTTTSFINRNNGSARVQRRATVAVTR